MGRKKLTTEQWVEACRAKRLDFDDYDFSMVEYVDNKTKVQVIHKSFPDYQWYVRPMDFKDGVYSHPMVNGKYRFTTEQWIDEVKKVRDDFYDYDFSKVEYLNAKTKVLIRHKSYPEYDWFVLPFCFKDKGVSHPLLHNAGYSRTDFKNSCIKNNKGKGYLYLIYFICEKSGEEFCKIGITSRSVKERFSSNKYSHLKAKKIVLLEQEPNLIYDLENDILREYKKYKFTPEIQFVGQTECFTSNAWPIILKEKLSQYLIT